MRRGSHGSWLLGLATAVAQVATGGIAAAHGGMDEERPQPEAPAGAEPSHEQGDGHEAPEGEEKPFAVSLDVVLGWGKVPFAVQNLPTTGSQAITYSRADAAPSDVQSFVLGGDFEATEHFGVGVRIPFTFGTVSPTGSAARSTTALENVELESEWSTRLSANLRLVAGLGVALPTAQGEEIPATLVNASSVDVGSYDRYSVARAAELARGYEANALFEPGRLGAIPQITLSYKGPRFRFEPYLKVENLIRTSSSLDAPYVGEAVGAVRAGYLIGSHVEAAIRGWINVGFAGTPDDRTTVVAVEPDVVGSFGPVKLYGGVVVPLVGPPEDAGFFGVRLGLAVAF